ncbi:WCX domain-containing protein [Nocardia seriolae]|uniref:WYL domain-containing protein n=1 Tax=Nocardia seriolae TaxID=37332 RepID=UPI00336575E9
MVPGRALRQRYPDGYRRIRLPIESIDRSVPYLLRLGSGAEVLAPEELRHAMAAEVAAMARVYRG